jgi:general secretion pathway protein E
VHVLSNIEELPKAPYNTEANRDLPTEWKPAFAVLGVGAFAVLLIEASVSKPVVFEVVRQLKALGITVGQRITVTHDLIALVHKQAEAQRSIDAQRGARDDSDSQKLAFAICNDAVDSGASDIHIETRDNRADILFRIDGIRVLRRAMTFEDAESMCTVLYSVHGDATSKDISWSKDTVQDTVIEHRTPHGVRVQLRFSSSPIFPAGNFHCVIRILEMDAKNNRGLDDLGYYPVQLEAINNMLIGSSGLVLLVGPTNSGKSTTMQAMLTRLFERRGASMKIITVEDPVEYVVHGACQIGVPRSRKSLMDTNDSSVFTTFLRGTLRQDPDAVVIGEVRDRDSAEVVRDMVLAGRKVLTTLHASSALWTFVRLKEMGVPYDLLTMPGFLSGIVYQRLIPRLCPHCSKVLRDDPSRIPGDVLVRLSRVADIRRDDVRVRGAGCPECHHTGFSGRIPVCEIVLPDPHLLQLIAANDLLSAESHWRTSASVPIPSGGSSVLAHAIAVMRAGVVDPCDVETQVAMLDKEVADVANVGLGAASSISAARVQRAVPLNAIDLEPVE